MRKSRHIAKKNIDGKLSAETFDVKIEKIVPGGFGLAFAENLTVFVSLAAAGDELKVRIREQKGKVAFAEIVEIIKPSPERRNAPCKYFGVCGGCDFQQMTYAAQIKAKTAIIRDCLTRIGKINYERQIEVMASPQEFAYRARARWHLDTRNRKIGYFKRFSHNIIDVEECPILVLPLQNSLANFRHNLSWEEFWAETTEIETAASGEALSVYSAELIEPTQELSFNACGEKYFYDAQSFFQGNPFLIEKLIETAIGDAKGENALDLFCGVGLFSLPLARKFTKVFAVEASGKAVEFAEKNAANARLQNIEFFPQSTNDLFAETSLPAIDFVLLDPPRTGAERETLENIVSLKPAKISYVSCDPATLARDLKILTENHYAIEKITAADLFPQTHHIETIVHLKLQN